MTHIRCRVVIVKGATTSDVGVRTKFKVEGAILGPFMDVFAFNAGVVSTPWSLSPRIQQP